MAYAAESAINQAVEAVIALANTLHLYAAVTRGALPTGDGIVCEIGPSRPLETFLDKEIYLPLDLTFNAKHSDLMTVSDALNAIHRELTMARAYPSGAAWEIVDITNETMPQVIGREQNNEWLMASSLAVKIHLKGD